MTLTELLPVARSLPQTDKVRLIQALASDFLPLEADTHPALLPPGQYPMWSPYESSDAATALLSALAKDR